ncbi:MAG TPA: tripartite tricarboxylate transporter substrate-binding protein, partial [Burkholderiaceae bacterium]|nr:tripartite tricarboxylate transporter substrate-binding protein [Burkholderiaceae bacterium]
GHTYFLGAVHDLIAAVGYSKLGFDLDHDLLPIAQVAHLPLAVVINAKELAAPDFVALLKYLRKHRGVRFTSAGVGTPGHFAGEQFAVYARTALEHVAAQSASMALEDLLAGKADLMFEALGVVAPYLRAGALRALAVASTERLSAYPQIPTLTEFGWLADLPSYRYGLWAVGAAPAVINARMAKALTQALAQPSLRLALAHFGAEPSVPTDGDFKTNIRREINHWFDAGGLSAGSAK